MDYNVEMLIEVLGEFDQKTADLIGLALEFGKSGSDFLSGMLQRKLMDAIDYVETLALAEDNETEYLDNDDTDSDYLDEEELEELVEEIVEPEPDLLSEKFGMDVDEATPIQLANRIVYMSKGDEATQMSLIKELADRGKSLAQLSTLVEGL